MRKNGVDGFLSVIHDIIVFYVSCHIDHDMNEINQNKENSKGRLFDKFTVKSLVPFIFDIKSEDFGVINSIFLVTILLNNLNQVVFSIICDIFIFLIKGLLFSKS